jgi:type VI protein secretion system component Hcp
MSSFAIRLRALAGVIALAAACLAAVPAQAQTYSTTINISGLPGDDGNGNYNNLISFAWGPDGAPTLDGVAPELTITLNDDSTSAALMQAANSRELFSAADLQLKFAGPGTLTTVVNIQMTNVQIQSVHIAVDPNIASGVPVQILTLRFSAVTYTFQPVNPVGQPAGPPVTYSATYSRASSPVAAAPSSALR